MELLIAAGVFVIVILLLMVAVRITWALSTRFTSLEANNKLQADQISQLLERVDALEKSKKKSNPLLTDVALEDVGAILRDAAWQAVDTLQYVETRVRQAEQAVNTVRRDPRHYDENRSNGKRPGKGGRNYPG